MTKEEKYICPEDPACLEGEGYYIDSYYHCNCDWCVDHSYDTEEELKEREENDSPKHE